MPTSENSFYINMFKKIFFILIMVTSFKSSYADFEYAGNVTSFQKFDGWVEFKLSNAQFNVYIIDNNIIRFRFTNRSEFSQAPSYAVIYHNSVPYDFTEENDSYQISTPDLIVRISKSPCRVRIFDHNMNLLNEDEKSFGMSYDNDDIRCFKTLFQDELFYGLGEKTKSLKKNGEIWTMWNSDTPAYTEKQDPLYQSIPFFIGIRNHKAYGIFLDNTYKSHFNMGASNNRFYWFGAEKGELDYYFINGPEIKKVINLYTMLTGRMELPPMWSLGYQQSKWSYYPESTVRALAETFRNKKIPCDVIYLDIHYMDGYRVFTWDKNRFPDPEKLLSDLRSQGFKVITIIDPGVKADTVNYKASAEGLNQDLFVKYPDGIVYQGQVWPGWAYFPDFTKKETRKWWGKKNADLFSQGVSGIWNDMNEPSAWGQAIPDILQFNDNGFGANYKKIHNVYALEMAEATFEGIKENKPGTRPFILTRAGFSGIQRYAAVWTGDNVASEIHLKLACTMVQGLSLSGVTFCGSDVGGFFDSPSPRLYTRWMQLGAFSPFYRGHTIINTRDQEPWAFGDDVENWVREIVNLRYELLPFFYNEFYNASSTGVPVVRSMFLNFQNDDECYSDSAQYQFMVGDNLLVAPVLSEYENFKKLYLPEGKWLDWWNNKVYDGSQWIIVEAPINRIPLFVREGGVIPIQAVQNYVGEKKINELTFKIFPSEKSSYSFYQDDGISLEYNNGKYLLTDVNVKNDSALEITINIEKGDYKPGMKSYIFNIYRDSAVNKISVNGSAINSVKNIYELNNTDKGYAFDSSSKNLSLKISYQPELKIIIN